MTDPSNTRLVVHDHAHIETAQSLVPDGFPVEVDPAAVEAGFVVIVGPRGASVPVALPHVMVVETQLRGTISRLRSQRE